MKVIDFINVSPTAFHAAANVKSILMKNGFEELYEFEEWKLQKGGRYFVMRNGSSIIAFEVPLCNYAGLCVCASHTDSPSFKLKASPELTGINGLIRLNIEGYGGMARETWFDRPLSVAGRIAAEVGGTIKEILVNIDRDIAVIPSLAVHMGKARSEERANIQNEMLPILRSEGAQKKLIDLIADTADVKSENIKGCDLYLYNREKGTVFGADNEFIASGRIDNLENVYISLSALLNSMKTSQKNEMLRIYAAFDNEETGSLTRQGAESTFFNDVIVRINEALGVSSSEYMRRLASSFVMSVDNAHAMHPNYAAKADPINRPALNGGVVLKFNASGRYTTDAVSAAFVKTLAERAGVPVQEYHNRSDIAGGSTLGNLMNRHISVMSADIGLAQLAMHSAYETAGAKDTEYMEKLLTEFYNTTIKAGCGGQLELIR
ncbi:MAG: M18 family aminopeptidase [Clostridiales bacterium]|nr:M18 family aminopeptidase [Clostridiales bacterium]